MPGDPLIKVRDLSYQVGGNLLLDNLNFEITRGEYVGILGPNGGGKTTLLKLLLGLQKPTHGVVELYGVPVHKFKQKYKIGYVPQRLTAGTPNLPATVEEVITSGLTAKLGPFKSPKAEDKKAIAEAVEICGIGYLLDHSIIGLSGGERQRVFIARSLAARPEILLLDEPVTGVDIAAQERFYQFIAQLNQELKLTLLFVSHDLGVIAGQVSTLLCLNKTLICHGAPEASLDSTLLNQLYGESTPTHLHHHHHDHS